MTERKQSNTGNGGVSSKHPTKKRKYSERWYRWRKHLNDTKLANPSLEFWEVLILASETYDTINHKPTKLWV